MWLFPVATSLHNLEEALTMPSWSLAHGQGLVSEGGFRFALIVLTALAWLTTALAARRGGRWERANEGYQGAMLANVLLPHLFGAILLGGYVPGLLTALCLSLPVDGGLLASSVRGGRSTPGRILASSALAGTALLAAIPALFAAGDWLTLSAPR